jgi:CPA1 family monovalent cation:H+ antiporter
MELFQIITILVVISATLDYINTKFLKFPTTIGLMLLALCLTFIISVIGFAIPSVSVFFKSFVQSINFSQAVLNVMLCYLLFAGAMHTDWEALKKQLLSVIIFSTIVTCLYFF